MKTTFKIILCCLTIFWLNSSCSPDDSLDLFVVSDFTVTMDENPTERQLIGSIPYENFEEHTIIRFFITSQNDSNAIYFQGASIHVYDPILFDFETNPIIVANVKVQQGYWVLGGWDYQQTKTITVTINLNDLPD